MKRREKPADASSNTVPAKAKVVLTDEQKTKRRQKQWRDSKRKCRAESQAAGTLPVKVVLTKEQKKERRKEQQKLSKRKCREEPGQRKQTKPLPKKRKRAQSQGSSEK